MVGWVGEELRAVIDELTSCSRRGPEAAVGPPFAVSPANKRQPSSRHMFFEIFSRFLRPGGIGRFFLFGLGFVARGLRKECQWSRGLKRNGSLYELEVILVFKL